MTSVGYSIEYYDARNSKYQVLTTMLTEIENYIILLKIYSILTIIRLECAL